MTPEQIFAPATMRFPRRMTRHPLAAGIARTIDAWRSIWAREARIAKQAQLSGISRALQSAHDGRSRIVVP